MGFGKQQTAARISSDRLAAMTGVETAGGEPPPRVSLEPDLSRIRKNRLEETPEERQQRLAAKTVNFSTTFLIRSIILVAVAWFGYNAYQMTGDIHRGIAIGMFVMAGDFGRVMLKAMEPGTK